VILLALMESLISQHLTTSTSTQVAILVNTLTWPLSVSIQTAATVLDIKYVLLKNGHTYPCVSIGHNSTMNGNAFGCTFSNSASTTTTTKSTKSTTTAAATSSCTAGSYNLKKGDGYKGACCKTEADCKDNCINGVCNGLANTKTTISKSSSTSKSTVTTATKSTTKTITTKKSTTKATTTTKSSTVTATASCTTGYQGKVNGKEPKNACCTTEANCIDNCVKRKCT
jgi:flagellar hook-associated protein FlgK